MVKKIRICPQKEAEALVPKLGNAAVISITSADRKSIDWGDVPVFRMKFNDTDDALDQNSAALKNFSGLKEFLDSLEADVLVIHCYAGISRSAAVAAAVAEYLGIRMKIWSNKRYEPNVLVYELAKETLFGTPAKKETVQEVK